MKCHIPEISWHNREPVLSIDIQKHVGDASFYRLASGGSDTHIVIWHLNIEKKGAVNVEFASDLSRHQKAVNVVRFSPCAQFLASGDDDSIIIIWKQKLEYEPPDTEGAEKEQWTTLRYLRGHVDDVYDLSWSPESVHIISGSVDNSAVMWKVETGRRIAILADHKSFIQGVSWDPKNEFVTTMSADRTCRIYKIATKKTVSNIKKACLPVPDGSELDGKVVRLFHDDSLKSYFRRLEFSPDGKLLIVPSGIIEGPDGRKLGNATHIFTRLSLKKPVVYLPCLTGHTVAVRCCPVLFNLRNGNPLFALPYRIVFAVATQRSIVMYDTEQAEPFGIVSNITFTQLTDISWSSDGRVLLASSSDGYCSIVVFAEGEIGTSYDEHKDKHTNSKGENVFNKEESSDGFNINTTHLEKKLPCTSNTEEKNTKRSNFDGSSTKSDVSKKDNVFNKEERSDGFNINTTHLAKELPCTSNTEDKDTKRSNFDGSSTKSDVSKKDNVFNKEERSDDFDINTTHLEKKLPCTSNTQDKNTKRSKFDGSSTKSDVSKREKVFNKEERSDGLNVNTTHLEKKLTCTSNTEDKDTKRSNFDGSSTKSDVSKKDNVFNKEERSDGFNINTTHLEKKLPCTSNTQDKNTKRSKFDGSSTKSDVSKREKVFNKEERSDGLNVNTTHLEKKLPCTSNTQDKNTKRSKFDGSSTKSDVSKREKVFNKEERSDGLNVNTTHLEKKLPCTSNTEDKDTKRSNFDGSSTKSDVSSTKVKRERKKNNSSSESKSSAPLSTNVSIKSELDILKHVDNSTKVTKNTSEKLSKFKYKNAIKTVKEEKILHGNDDASIKSDSSDVGNVK